MPTNAAEHVRLTKCAETIRREVHRDCVRHWTPDEIARIFPDGYPDDLLRKGRQSCEPSVMDEMP